MWRYTSTEELYHFGVPGMKWGIRKKYKANLADIKRNYRNRNSNIQKDYDIAEARIESKYKRGQALSKKDYARELAADNKAQSRWAKSKATYKDDIRKAKSNYKSEVQKMKSDYKSNLKQLKSNRTADDILVFNEATRRKAAQYMTENKMSMSEAKKKAKGDAVKNTAVILGVIGGYTLYELARNKLQK